MLVFEKVVDIFKHFLQSSSVKNRLVCLVILMSPKLTNTVVLGVALKMAHPIQREIYLLACSSSCSRIGVAIFISSIN
jgi:hypothetical protein